MSFEIKVAGITAVFLLSMTACSFLLQGHAVRDEPSQVLSLRHWPEQDRDVSRNIIVPVAGVSPKSLRDTWGAPRGSGRAHKGIDIMADKGAPVVAATAGRVIRLFESERGGITLYQSDEEGQYIFYYAHLGRYADGVKPGMRVRQGQVLAYVGETGNAPVPHLHFEIQRQNAARQWWRGEAFNPYPVLLSGTLHKKAEKAHVLARMK